MKQREQDKTKEQLMQEISALRQRNAELESLVKQGQRTQELLTQSEQAIRSLYTITAAPELNFEQKVQKLLVMGCRRFSLPLGILARIEGEQYEVTAASPDNAIAKGMVLALGNTYCRDTLRANGPIGFEYAAQSKWRTHPAYTKLGLEVYLGTPVWVGGQVYGTLNFSSPKPRQEEAFSDTDKDVLQLMAQWIGGEIERQQAEEERKFTQRERRQSQEALRASDARLRLVLDSAQIGDWDLDLLTKPYTANRSLKHDQIFGYESLLPNWSYESFLEHVHPEDRESVDLKFKRTFVTGESWDFECRIIRFDETIRWIWARGSFYYDINNQPTRILGIVTDITDRKQAEEERERLLKREQAARTEAEAANRIKDEFLAVLSHELRTPLNPILGWAKLLRSRKFDEKSQARALETIERNAKLQTQLIEDLLDVSRILQGKLSIQVCQVNLRSTIEAALETVRLAAEAKLIQIQTVFDANVGQVAGDSNRLQQVIWNLLSNAVKFTPSGGRVEVRLERIGTDAQIQVRDTGKGINSEFLPYVFDHFRQADSTTTRIFGGLGLGLAIVRHLVEMHGGTVFAESLGEGLGATFTVKLPLVTAGHATSEDYVPLDDSPNLQGLRVLVVDDEVDTCELLQFILEQYGASVRAVASAKEALDAIAQELPDILLSDIGMPGMDGYMLIRAIRAMSNEQGGNIRAIALTAYAGETNQQQIFQAGFQRHVTKPVEPAQLAAVIVSLVGMQQAASN